MPILDPADRTRLLAIDRFNRYVNRMQRVYVVKVSEWKQALAPLPDISRPDVLPYILADMLEAYLRMSDEKLASDMRDAWGEDDARVDTYYRFIARHFVDLALRG